MQNSSDSSLVYQLISSSEVSSSESLDNDIYERGPHEEMMMLKTHSSKHMYNIFFILSLLANIAFVNFFFFASKPPSADVAERSKFAGLTRTIPKQWTYNEPANESDWEDIWDHHSSYDAGVVALDDDYARSMGLPRAQRWPWARDKGIYLINAYHNLHCARNLKTSFTEFRSNLSQSIPWPHIQHCLLVWRDEIMCNADDTPRYSGFQDSHHSALGQVRMCRDWKALEEWANDGTRSGCWKHIPGQDGKDGFKELDRYRFCPPGSQYEEISKSKWAANVED